LKTTITISLLKFKAYHAMKRAKRRVNKRCFAVIQAGEKDLSPARDMKPSNFKLDTILTGKVNWLLYLARMQNLSSRNFIGKSTPSKFPPKGIFPAGCSIFFRTLSKGEKKFEYSYRFDHLNLYTQGLWPHIVITNSTLPILDSSAISHIYKYLIHHHSDKKKELAAGVKLVDPSPKLETKTLFCTCLHQELDVCFK
jgi:hypothetical protein